MINVDFVSYSNCITTLYNCCLLNSFGSAHRLSEHLPEFLAMSKGLWKIKYCWKSLGVTRMFLEMRQACTIKHGRMLQASSTIQTPIVELLADLWHSTLKNSQPFSSFSL